MAQSPTMSADPKGADAFASKSSIWILGVFRDSFLFIGPPLFIVPLVFWAAGVWGTGDVYMFAISCAALGHHVPGMIRAYCDRALFRRFKYRFTLAPLFFLSVCVFCTFNDYSGLAVVVYLWGVWHGMMQAYGFARIYDAKISSFEKTVCRLDFALCFFWFVSGTVSSPDRMAHIIRQAYRTGVPFIEAHWLGLLSDLFLGSALVLTAIYIGFNFFRYKRGEPISPLKFLVLLSSIALWWLTSVSVSNLLLGIAMWEIFHALQYNVIVWAHNRKRAASTENVGALLRILFKPQASMILIYSGIVFAYGGLSYLNEALGSGETQAFVTAFFIASALVHYYFDGFIWKVRDVDVADTMGIQRSTSRTSGLTPGALVPLLKWGWFVVPLAGLITLQISYSVAGKADFAGRARLDLSKAVVASLPFSSEARYQLGKACLERNRYDEAIAHLKVAIEVREDFVDAWVDLGTAYQMRSQTDEDLEMAKKSYRKSLIFAPGLATANSNLGLILMNQQAYEEALAYLTLATEVEPTNSLMRGNLADANFALGRYQEAAQQYSIAVQTEKDSEYKSFYAAQVTRAQTAAEQNLGPPARPKAVKPKRQNRNYSNIYPSDYVGPQVCSECHSEQYDLWQKHPHRKMNLDVEAETVLGDFSGTELEYGDGKAKFETKNGEFFMTLFQGEIAVRSYRVTRTVGSRFIQMYVGVLVMGTKSPENRRAEEEGKLPFSYSLTRKIWYPETYDDPWHKSEFTAEGSLTKPYRFYDEKAGHWATNCAWCHNTYPYSERLKLPAEVTGLQDYWYGFRTKDIKYDATLSTDRLNADNVSLDTNKLVTVGISCESCHFGGRLHAHDGWPIQFVPAGPNFEFSGGSFEKMSEARQDPYVINSVCGQCHSSRNPAYPDGSGTWNSREARDLNAGACTSEIKCTDCHDPHAAGPASADNVDEERFNQVCLSCHESFRDDAKRQAHAAHSPEALPSCMDCHMPRIVHGLSDMVRSHAITSPGDSRMLSVSAPNACNLCHLDKPISWTLQELDKNWGIKHKTDKKWDAAYGGTLEHPVGKVWLNHTAPVVRQVAVDAYSRSPLGPSELKELVRILDDEVAANRMMGVTAIERIMKRPISKDEYSPYSRPEKRAAQIKALIP